MWLATNPQNGCTPTVNWTKAHKFARLLWQLIVGLPTIPSDCLQCWKCYVPHDILASWLQGWKPTLVWHLIFFLILLLCSLLRLLSLHIYFAELLSAQSNWMTSLVMFQKYYVFLNFIGLQQENTACFWVTSKFFKLVVFKLQKCSWILR